MAMATAASNLQQGHFYQKPLSKDSPLKAMFRLLNDAETLVTAGLVLHRESALKLVDEVDCVSFGMANVSPHIRALLAARRHLC